LKISKPVIFTLVFAIGVFLYLFVFSDKKTPPIPAPNPQANQATLSQQLLPTADSSSTLQPAIPQYNEKTRAKVYAELKSIEWGRDPFAVPGYVEQKLSEQIKDSRKLVAIIEGKKENIAIIDNEIVKKGDMIGNEKIQEIGGGKIVLVNKGIKREITVQDTPTADVEIKIKKRGR